MATIMLVASRRNLLNKVHVVSWTLLYFFASCYSTSTANNEHTAREFLTKLNDEFARMQNRVSLAEWNYASNLTEENLNEKLKVSSESAKFVKEKWLEVQKYNWKEFKDFDLKRQFYKYSILGEAALSEDDYKKLEKIVATMEDIYSTAKICDFKDPKNCKLALEPELTEIMASSKNADELKHVWVEWRNSTGKKCKKYFPEYVRLLNEAAKLNNFSDNSEYWLHEYEDSNIRQEFQNLWKQVEPFYHQMHAFVRHELRKVYGDVVSETGPIPAHLLGNMWAQTWSNIAQRTLPFPDEKIEDVSSEMVKQGYTPLKMFKLAEEFFVSLNLSPMPETFWKNSIIEKPKDREIICHASAWDFYDRKDFRIKQCTRINNEDLFTVHHEMGHVQYYLQYKDQPIKYREGANPGHFRTVHHEMGHVQYFLQYKHLDIPYRKGANPGFHEAVGDVMSLSVSTQNHLRKIGLIKSNSDSYKSDLNHLYSTALDKIVFLPFALAVDTFRWGIFEGKITPDMYNCEWWKLRQKYQGIEPPVDRSVDDFDAGAKYHVIASVPYIRYFVSFVIQFQFHKALCEKAGQYVPNDPNKPLHRCDIYQNTEAGQLLKNMLQLGSSKPWPDAMEALTGQRKMDASGLLEYFKPILDFITEKNKENGVYVGWKDSNKEFGCPSPNRNIHRRFIHEK